MRTPFRAGHALPNTANCGMHAGAGCLPLLRAPGDFPPHRLQPSKEQQQRSVTESSLTGDPPMRRPVTIVPDGAQDFRQAQVCAETGVALFIVLVRMRHESEHTDFPRGRVIVQIPIQANHGIGVLFLGWC